MATPASVPPVPTAETKPSTLPPVWRQISCAGRADMAVAVGDIVELVGPDRAVRLAPRQLLGQPAGHLHVVVRVLVGHRRHLDQLGAEQPQRVLLLLALGVGNDDHRAVAERLGDQRQADAGVAGGALDDDAARPRAGRARSASRMMNSPARSLTDWPGFMNSALPRISQPVSSEARFSRISGVLPIASITELSMKFPLVAWSRDPRNAGSGFQGRNLRRFRRGRDEFCLTGHSPRRPQAD